MVEIHRVLKPGGRMYFIENVGHGTGVKAAVQSTYGKVHALDFSVFVCLWSL